LKIYCPILQLGYIPHYLDDRAEGCLLSLSLSLSLSVTRPGMEYSASLAFYHTRYKNFYNTR